MLESKVEFSSRNEEVTAVEVLRMTCFPNRTVPMGETPGTQLWHRVCLGTFVHRCVKIVRGFTASFSTSSSSSSCSSSSSGSCWESGRRPHFCHFSFGISALQPNTVRFEREVFGRGLFKFGIMDELDEFRKGEVAGRIGEGRRQAAVG